MLRADDVIRELFNSKHGMAILSTFGRFFGKFTIEGNDVLFSNLMRQWWWRKHIAKLTVDFDSTEISRHGKQGGAQVGYNSQKHDRASHHLLMDFAMS